jgi:hypothetical protein
MRLCRGGARPILTPAAVHRLAYSEPGHCRIESVKLRLIAKEVLDLPFVNHLTG